MVSDKPLFRALLGVTKLLEAVGAIIILIAVILNVAQVVYRYFLVDPLSWTEEVMRYAMGWVTFLVAAAAVFRGEETTAGLFDNTKSVLLRRVLHIFKLACTAAFALVLVIYGFPFALGAARQLSSAAQIPMIYAYLSIGVGGALMIVMCIGLLFLPGDTIKSSGEAIRPEDIA
jgi:TRAP-type C4-dicarboxylate transport system permease small subunit